MTSKERAYAAIALGKPDRVPVDLHNFLMTAEMSGLPYGEVFQKAELMAEAQINTWKRFKHDIIIFEVGDYSNAEAMGMAVDYGPDRAPVGKAPILEKLSDVRKLKVPDPWTTWPWNEILKATQILVRELGDQVFIMGRADQGPFDLAAELRGLDNFLMDLALGEELELAHELLDLCREAATRFAVAQKEAGAHATSVGESFAGPNVVSPQMYYEFAWPYEKRMAADLKKAGILFANHICGDATPIIEAMVSTGAEILEVDERADWAKCKQAAMGKTTLLGPISPTRLRWGTPDEIDALCKEAIEIAMPGAGFILGPGCALAGDTPHENIDALVESARKYGVYRW